MERRVPVEKIVQLRESNSTDQAFVRLARAVVELAYRDLKKECRGNKPTDLDAEDARLFFHPLAGDLGEMWVRAAGFSWKRAMEEARRIETQRRAM